MRLDILNAIKSIKEDREILNISELSRRFNCDRRTVSKYLAQRKENLRKRQQS